MSRDESDSIKDTPVLFNNKTLTSSVEFCSTKDQINSEDRYYADTKCRMSEFLFEDLRPIWWTSFSSGH